MFWNRSEVMHYSRFAPTHVLEKDMDVVSIWRNDDGISLFFEALDEEKNYSVLYIKIPDPIKRRKQTGYLTFCDEDEQIKIQCINRVLTAAELTADSIRADLEQYTYQATYNIPKDQTENLIPSIKCLVGKSISPGESLEKINLCFKAAGCSFTIDLVEITSTSCVIS